MYIHIYMFTYIYHKKPPNVDKHTINGWYGEWRCQIFHHFSSEKMLTELDSRIKKLHLAIQNPKRMGKFRKSDSILRRNGHNVAVYFYLGVLAPISNKHTRAKKSVTWTCACFIVLGIRTLDLRTLGSLLLGTFRDPKSCWIFCFTLAAMVGISLACTPTRQPEMDLTIEMRPTFPVEVKLPSKKVQKPCNFEQLEMVDELDLRPFRSSFYSTCLARTTKTKNTDMT